MSNPFRKSGMGGSYIKTTHTSCPTHTVSSHEWGDDYNKQADSKESACSL